MQELPEVRRGKSVVSVKGGFATSGIPAMQVWSRPCGGDSSTGVQKCKDRFMTMYGSASLQGSG